MAFGLAAYASRHGSRRTALDSLPAADQALPDGLSTRKDSDERFQFHFIKTSPFLELLDARDILLFHISHKDVPSPPPTYGGSLRPIKPPSILISSISPHEGTITNDR